MPSKYAERLKMYILITKIKVRRKQKQPQVCRIPHKFIHKKCHLIAIQEISVSTTAMTHTYWTAPFFYASIISSSQFYFFSGYI